MKPSEAIRKARAHISDPAMWFQGEYWHLYDSSDWNEPPDNVACCGMGATGWAYGDDPDNYLPTDRFMNHAARNRGFQSFPHFNDSSFTKHADVLACMEEAAKLAEEAGQ